MVIVDILEKEVLLLFTTKTVKEHFKVAKIIAIINVKIEDILNQIVFVNGITDIAKIIFVRKLEDQPSIVLV